MLTPLFEFIIKSVVDKQEAVVVTESRQDQKIVIGIKVHEEDVGRIIGKDGQTIRALRMLASALTPVDHETVVDILN